MGFYTRGEDNVVNAYDLLLRKRSVSDVHCIGAPAYSHLIHRPYNTLPDIMSQLGYRLPFSVDVKGERKLNSEVLEIADALSMKIYQERSVSEEDIARVLGLEKLPSGGWISYLPGVCANEYFRAIPEPSQCSNGREGKEYQYISCFEGKRLRGSDLDIGTNEVLTLFIPRRIVWIFDVKIGKKIMVNQQKIRVS